MQLDSTFYSLADPIRRDILKRVSRTSLSISEIAIAYNLTFAAISKHIKVLEKAKLVIKKRKGKEQIVSLAPRAFADANEYLDWYAHVWEKRMDSLDKFLQNN